LVDWLIGILVGGFIHLEKYESQWEGDGLGMDYPLVN